MHDLADQRNAWKLMPQEISRFYNVNLLLSVFLVYYLRSYLSCHLNQTVMKWVRGMFLSKPLVTGRFSLSSNFLGLTEQQLDTFSKGFLNFAS